MRRLSRLAAIAALVIASSGEAAADLRYEASTSPDGIPFIMVAGIFEVGDDLRDFERLALSGDPIAVVFHSAGGFPPKAMELGRLIRRLGLSTFQPHGLECTSACALAFLGGVDRYADPGSIGVHQTYFDTGTPRDMDAAVSAIQLLTADTLDYLAEMGVDPGFLALSMRYDGYDLRTLSGSEMLRFRVTTDGRATGDSISLPPARPASATGGTERGGYPGASPEHFADEPDAGDIDRSVPEACSGRVRHAKGHAALMQRPNVHAMAVADFGNGAAVEIVGSDERWYRVRLGPLEGYMHPSWVFVDQYESGGFEDALHVQLRSFDNYPDAAAFVRSSAVPVVAYLVNNGGYAVALRETLEKKHARALANHLRRNGKIPASSFITYGNTYVRKVCCG
jgi:hypothetical protein